jgi:hypothetical protein
MLVCKECGAKAVITDGVIIRDCVHKNAGVVAGLKAVCSGKGGLK